MGPRPRQGAEVFLTGAIANLYQSASMGPRPLARTRNVFLRFQINPYESASMGPRPRRGAERTRESNLPFGVSLTRTNLPDNRGSVKRFLNIVRTHLLCYPLPMPATDFSAITPTLDPIRLDRPPFRDGFGFDTAAFHAGYHRALLLGRWYVRHQPNLSSTPMAYAFSSTAKPLFAVAPDMSSDPCQVLVEKYPDLELFSAPARYDTHIANVLTATQHLFALGLLANQYSYAVYDGHKHVAYFMFDGDAQAYIDTHKAQDFFWVMPPPLRIGTNPDYQEAHEHTTTLIGTSMLDQHAAFTYA